MLAVCWGAKMKRVGPSSGAVMLGSTRAATQRTVFSILPPSERSAEKAICLPKSPSFPGVPTAAHTGGLAALNAETMTAATRAGVLWSGRDGGRGCRGRRWRWRSGSLVFAEAMRTKDWRAVAARAESGLHVLLHGAEAVSGLVAVGGEDGAEGFSASRTPGRSLGRVGGWAGGVGVVMVSWRVKESCTQTGRCEKASGPGALGGKSTRQEGRKDPSQAGPKSRVGPQSSNQAPPPGP
ncbi:hypothetical protein BU16DRAFT_192671 [Lophium mytilinum]|uniref:Uncharacterized protein n=1 Tax=Lophium mytilinum TaxID=390894 RepID=A0A6A6RA19_9PEZI|nr:hypothetical protein BU16DRAFT_192671 [Lophium mytilinum]